MLIIIPTKSWVKKHLNSKTIWAWKHSITFIMSPPSHLYSITPTEVYLWIHVTWKYSSITICGNFRGKFRFFKYVHGVKSAPIIKIWSKYIIKSPQYKASTNMLFLYNLISVVDCTPYGYGRYRNKRPVEFLTWEQGLRCKLWEIIFIIWQRASTWFLP